MFKNLLELKQSDRPWHMPVLAGVCIGTPILIGHFTNHLAQGKLASMAALVILYLHSSDLKTRMVTLMTCAFGILFSFAIGSIFSFNHYVSAIVFALYACVVHFGLYHLKMTRPPGNFFFVMIASIAFCMPFNLEKIPHNIGLVALGTMGSCFFGLIYSIITLKKSQQPVPPVIKGSDKYANLTEAIIFGSFAGISLLIAQLFHLENPYWVPVSCLAIMHGVNAKHVLTRTAQRILGTFLGLVLTYLVLLAQPSGFTVALIIILCQILAETLIVRNYLFTVIFITVLTIFLAESNPIGTGKVNQLFLARFFDIALGSLIGGLGGLILHNEKVRKHAKRQMIKSQLVLKGNAYFSSK